MVGRRKTQELRVCRSGGASPRGRSDTSSDIVSGGAHSEQRTNHQIDADGGVARFHLGYSGLTRAEQLTELLLRHRAAASVFFDRARQFQFELDDSGFLVAQAEKLFDAADFPSSGLQSFRFAFVHQCFTLPDRRIAAGALHRSMTAAGVLRVFLLNRSRLRRRRVGRQCATCSHSLQSAVHDNGFQPTASGANGAVRASHLVEDALTKLLLRFEHPSRTVASLSRFAARPRVCRQPWPQSESMSGLT